MKKLTPLGRSRESGVVLLFSLIVLVVLLAGGVAVMRSMNSSLFSAGNLAFKRDLVNQGELAVSNVLTAFGSGALAAATTTADSVPAANYSAVQLQANPEVFRWYCLTTRHRTRDRTFWAPPSRLASRPLPGQPRTFPSAT
ncbi:MAG: hypothetical protein WKG52_05055 [Variovorax sp.]